MAGQRNCALETRAKIAVSLRGYWARKRDQLPDDTQQQERRRLRKIAYMAAWRKNNTEKMHGYQAKARAKHREKINALTAKWRAANLERARVGIMSWHIAHPERVRAIKAKWRFANPERNALRRAKKMEAVKELTKEELIVIREVYRQCRLMTKLTGIEYHVDHKIALAKGGKHHPDNLQLLTAKDNLQKGAK